MLSLVSPLKILYQKYRRRAEIQTTSQSVLFHLTQGDTSNFETQDFVSEKEILKILLTSRIIFMSKKERFLTGLTSGPRGRVLSST